MSNEDLKAITDLPQPMTLVYGFAQASVIVVLCYWLAWWMTK